MNDLCYNSVNDKLFLLLELNNRQRTIFGCQIAALPVWIRLLGQINLKEIRFKLIDKLHYLLFLLVKQLGCICL